MMGNFVPQKDSVINWYKASGFTGLFNTKLAG